MADDRYKISFIEYIPIYSYLNSVLNAKLYSKQVFKGATDSSLILYETMDGSSFVCFDFDNEKEFDRMYYCKDKNSCISYELFRDTENPLQEILTRTYAFKIDINTTIKWISLYYPSKHIKSEKYHPEGCIIKPIIQTKGFCYYHAVLHGLLIPKTMRQICCKKLLAYMDTLNQSTEPTYSLESFMNTGICENFTNTDSTGTLNIKRLNENTKYFVMKFIYQYLFHFEEIKSDINEVRYKYETKKTHPIEVLVKYYKKHNGPLSSLPEAGNMQDLTEQLFKTVLNVVISDKVNTNADIITEVKRFSKQPDERWIQRWSLFSFKKPLKDIPENYKLEYGLISILYNGNKDNEPSVWHGIIGVVCDDTYYIIDSNNIYETVKDCNWMSPELIQDSYRNKNISRIIINYYYVRKTESSTQTTCNAIKETYIQPRLFRAFQESNLPDNIKDKLSSTIRSVGSKRV